MKNTILKAYTLQFQILNSKFHYLQKAKLRN